jgi:nucleoside-diphosphate-sugar epimerase
LLTGGNGFLGSYIRQTLSQNNEVYTLSRSNSNYICDLGFDVPKLLDQFDLIIHAAGKAHSIPVNDIERSDFFNINVNGTINLLKGLFESHLPKQFVFISSVSVYGLTEGEGINEKFPLLAEDAYGKSKIEAERIVRNWCNENNVIYTILRLPLLVGVNPPGNLGAMIRGIEKGYYFNIAGGNARKSMVLASDIALCLNEITEVRGTYNLTDGIHPTFNELSNCIKKKQGKSFVPNLPIFIAKILAKIGDLSGEIFPINSIKLLKITSTLTFDDSKARQSFDWNPSSVLDNI